MYEDIFVVSTLPPKLSHEEFVSNMTLAKNGNLEARNIVIKHNIRLVLSIVYKKYKQHHELKELISIGLIGLIKAVDNYDISKNFKFSSFAAKCIENEILMYFRKNQKDKNVLSLEMIISNESDKDKFVLEDTLYNEDDDIIDNYARKETISYINEILDELNDRDKKIIMLNFGFYNRVYSQKEIALMFNLNQNYVSRLIKNILLKLKDRIELDKYIESINRLCLYK